MQLNFFMEKPYPKPHKKKSAVQPVQTGVRVVEESPREFFTVRPFEMLRYRRTVRPPTSHARDFPMIFPFPHHHRVTVLLMHLPDFVRPLLKATPSSFLRVPGPWEHRPLSHDYGHFQLPPSPACPLPPLAPLFRHTSKFAKF